MNIPARKEEKFLYWGNSPLLLGGGTSGEDFFLERKAGGVIIPRVGV